MLDALLTFSISFNLELDLALLVFISTHDALNNATLLHATRLHNLLLDDKLGHSVLAGSFILLVLDLKGLNKVLSAVLELLLAGQGHVAPVLVFACIFLSLQLELPLPDNFQLLRLPLSFNLLLKVPIDSNSFDVLAFINYLIDLLNFALCIYFA